MRDIILSASRVPVELPPYPTILRHHTAQGDNRRMTADFWFDVRFLFPRSTGVVLDRSSYALHSRHRYQSHNYNPKAKHPVYRVELKLKMFFVPRRPRCGNIQGAELRFTRVAEGFRLMKEKSNG